MPWNGFLCILPFDIPAFLGQWPPLIFTGRGIISVTLVLLCSVAPEQGVLLRPLGNVVYLLPPYGISEAELARVWSVIETFVTSSG